MVLRCFRSRAERGPERLSAADTYRVLHLGSRGTAFVAGLRHRTWFFHAPVPLDATTSNLDVPRPIERARVPPPARSTTWASGPAASSSPTPTVRRVFIARGLGPQPPPYGGTASTPGWRTPAPRVEAPAVAECWGKPPLLDSYTGEPAHALRRREKGDPPVASRTPAFSPGYIPRSVTAPSRAPCARYARRNGGPAWYERTTRIARRVWAA